jgi:hypothetical protein
MHSFQYFRGPHVLWSNYKRKCGECGKMIGKQGQSFSYWDFYDSSIRCDVCMRCHARNFRRYQKSSARKV